MAAMDSLWGDEFIIPETPKKQKKIIEKASKPKAVTITTEKAIKSKKLTLREQLEIIRENVLKILGRYIDQTVVIKTREQLHEYIDAAIANGEIAIDTETNNSLDPITCKLMGPCIYTPGQKNAYIPLNHINPDTRERLDWQLTEEDIREEFDRLTDALIIMHNGKFDYSVVKCTTGNILKIYWDTLIGAKVLDENEKSAGLKQQYIQKIDPSVEKYSIDHLFENVEYAVVDPDIFALYAATDAMMTYKLYKWQKDQFMLPENAGIYKLFRDIEMPLVEVLAEMQLRGMEVDQEYAQLLSKKFHSRLDVIDAKIAAELDKMSDKISAWRKTDDANFHPQASKPSADGTYKLQKSKNEQLEDPINLASPTQLAILFYDILGCPAVDKKKPRGTGEEELKAIAKHLNLDLCDLILDRRELVKLTTTYIDVIPELAKRWPDGRVRTHFNQYGAATGRLSSSDPINFQNIPSHEKSIRMLFKAREDMHDYIAKDNIFVIPITAEIETQDGWKYTSDVTVNDNLIVNGFSRLIRSINNDSQNYYISIDPVVEATQLVRYRIPYRIIGGDYSAQEPRLTAYYSNDENMINAYKENKDLYSVIASMSFDRPYEDCLEFYPEGTKIIHEGKEVICGNKTHQNPEGKKYRTYAKSLLLGMLYGRGARSVGEQIGKTVDEAQDIINKFFGAFPKVQKWINESMENAHKYGYVEDIAGRRRRLPDIQLPKYSIKDMNNTSGDFNPLLGAKGIISGTNNQKIAKYQQLCEKIVYARDYENLKKKALEENVEIHSNTGFIAQAERQAVNSRVQGGAATLTKNALIAIHNDQRLKDIGAYLINTVHDEILLEVPEYYSQKAEELLVDNMVESAKTLVPTVPMKCDTYNVNCWYIDEYFSIVQKEFKDMLKDGSTPEESFEKLSVLRCESTRDQLYEIVGGFMSEKPEDIVITKSFTRVKD